MVGVRLFNRKGSGKFDHDSSKSSNNAAQDQPKSVRSWISSVVEVVDIMGWIFRRRSPAVLTLTAFQVFTWHNIAVAHVKWFAPYIVGAPPKPVALTLRNPWFLCGIIAVLAFFIVARMVERSTSGILLHQYLDRATACLWHRIDDYVRVTVGAFFVAIFAVGGIYLTPDLKTPAEWVSWIQLIIAGLIFFRTTMPLAGGGIVVLWLLAAREYDLFHLLDYLALGLGVAAYLILEPLDEHWRKHRFESLRLGLSIALMWSSLEKFAYPEWFYPLVVEKPYLTFGLPQDVFIPMAGVAEFTMGFGLLWTSLIRRLSAVALLVIFTAAVYPFGRTDLIGHGLIMAILVAVVCDRDITAITLLKRDFAAIPIGLVLSMAMFMSGYWGLHLAIYGPVGPTEAAGDAKFTHSHNAEYPHGPASDTEIGAPPTKPDD
ncbi:hypothetical protein N185_36115 [Sinorhizobium sp. GW3]|nr:hypothetical protein N185_36115 [Sinorhizobium sp. GW3]